MVDVAAIFALFRRVAAKGCHLVAGLTIDEQGTINDFERFATGTADAFDVILVGIVAGQATEFFTDGIGAKYKRIASLGAFKVIADTIDEQRITEGDVEAYDGIALLYALPDIPGNSGLADGGLNDLRIFRRKSLHEEFVHIKLGRHSQRVWLPSDIERVFIQRCRQYEPLAPFHSLLIDLNTVLRLSHWDQDLAAVLRKHTLMLRA